MSKANKFKNGTENRTFKINNDGRKEVELKPSQVVRFGNNPKTEYWIDGNKYKVKPDKNYMIGNLNGKVEIEEYSKAGHGHIGTANIER
ncbi:MAG: hypothetical protein N4A59_13690 [Marinifilum sp.]|jgi:hypothetical protein|nr:hypothetical protein [Marinifilum sp.]